MNDTKAAPRRLAKVARAICTVGGGRGFAVESIYGPVVVTAAHCLPHLPPAHLAAHTTEVSYANILGPLGEPTSVWAECLFVDPVRDVAILGTPDTQALAEEAGAYETLVESLERVVIGPAPTVGPVWLFSLGKTWHRADARQFQPGGHVQVKSTAPIEGGMSGSPIVRPGGVAVATVALAEGMSSMSGSAAPLVESLPAWLSPPVASQLAKRHSRWIRQRLRATLNTGGPMPIKSGWFDDDAAW